MNETNKTKSVTKNVYITKYQKKLEEDKCNETQDYLLRLSSFYKGVCSDFGRNVECHLMNEYLHSSGKSVIELNELYKSSFLKTCRYCLVTWKNGMNNVYIEPEKKQSKSLRYLCNKKYDKLNKYQKKLVDKCNENQNFNYLVVQCLQCKKTSKLPLRKPKKVKEEDAEMIIDKEQVQKKKKKKKDLYAGLNPLVVAQSQLSNVKTKEWNKVHSKTDNVNHKSNLPSKNTNSNQLSRSLVKRLLTTTNNKNSVTPVVKKKSALSSFLDSL